MPRLLTVEGRHDAIGGEKGGVGPVLRVDVPEHRRHVLRLHRGQDAGVAGAVGRTEQARRGAEDGLHDAVGRLNLFADVAVAEPGHRPVGGRVVAATWKPAPASLRLAAAARVGVMAPLASIVPTFWPTWKNTAGMPRSASMARMASVSLGVRPVVEGERDVVERQPLAGHLERRLGLRLAAGRQHDVEPRTRC